MTVWDQLLAVVRVKVGEEDFRRWFGVTAYASDSGDQITVWVPTEAIRRHLIQHFEDELRRALRSLDRANTHIRFVVGGTDEDEGDDD